MSWPYSRLEIKCYNKEIKKTTKTVTYLAGHIGLG